MRKRDELTDLNSCMSRARDDERTFVLLERDEAMPATIRFWITKRIELGKNQPGDAQLVEAEDLARAIEAEWGAGAFPQEIATTKRQREILAHTIDLEGRIKAARNARCRIAREHRNYFNVAVGSRNDREVRALIGLGLMDSDNVASDGKSYYAHATDAGIAEMMPRTGD